MWESGSQNKEINTVMCARTHTRVLQSDEGATGEKTWEKSFFSAASYTSRNTLPLLTPTAINDLDMAGGIAAL